MSSHKPSVRAATPDPLDPEGEDAFQKLVEAGADANRHLYLLQIEFAQKSLIDEMTHFRTLLENLTGTTLTFVQWAGLSGPAVQRFADITRRWQEMAAHTIVELNELLAESLAARTGGAGNYGGTIDRRISARVIAFPDRRGARGAAA